MARYSMMNIPKVSKEMGGILKFQRVHKLPPSSSPILSKYDSYIYRGVGKSARLGAAHSARSGFAPKLWKSVLISTFMGVSFTRKHKLKP